MSRGEYLLSDRKYFLYHEGDATYLLIQPVDKHDLGVLDREVEVIKSMTKKPFSLVALLIDEWQHELTPWGAPPVFGKVPFGDGANETLMFILKKLLPTLATDGVYDAKTMRLVLGGYSLAGLFALWTAYQTDKFEGVVAASPSVWYPKWLDYASEKRPFVNSIYLSLGDKEEKAKNPVMSQVGNAIRRQYSLLSEQIDNTILEWNPGNHFVDSEKRMAKGFAWLLNLGE